MKRIAGILAIGGSLILISWVTSPAARTTPAGPQISAADVERGDQASQSITPLASQIDDQAAQLRARLSQPPPKPQPDRNPFAFGKRNTPKESRPAVRDLSPLGGKPVEKGYVPLPIALPSLVAITADARDGGLMRTAALSMNDELKIVKPGQMFDRFIVEAIGSDSVRLIDVTSPTRATFIVAIR